MPSYFGSKKISQMFFNGKEIKEAWYNGEKVFDKTPPISTYYCYLDNYLSSFRRYTYIPHLVESTGSYTFYQTSAAGNQQASSVSDLTYTLTREVASVSSSSFSDGSRVWERYPSGDLNV